MNQISLEMSNAAMSSIHLLHTACRFSCRPLVAVGSNGLLVTLSKRHTHPYTHTPPRKHCYKVAAHVNKWGKGKTSLGDGASGVE
eukprot:2907968-Amphidinium_carterae.1